MLPSKRQSVNSLIINRVSCRDSVKKMIDTGLQNANDFLWKIYMKYNYVERKGSKLRKVKHAYQHIEDAAEQDKNFTRFKKVKRKETLGPDGKTIVLEKDEGEEPQIY